MQEQQIKSWKWGGTNVNRRRVSGRRRSSTAINRQLAAGLDRLAREAGPPVRRLEHMPQEERDSIVRALEARERARRGG